jgi:hypothetical protein
MQAHSPAARFEKRRWTFPKKEEFRLVLVFQVSSNVFEN